MRSLRSGARCGARSWSSSSDAAWHRHAKYLGTAKVEFQVALAATVANLFRAAAVYPVKRRCGNVGPAMADGFRV